MDLSQLQIGLLAGIAAAALGGGVVLYRRIRAEEARIRQRTLDDQKYGQQLQEGGDNFLVRSLNRLGEAASGEKTSAGLKEQLAHAGYHSANASAIYLGSKVCGFVLGVAFTALLMMRAELSTPVKLFALASVGAMLSFVPNFIVTKRRSGRAAEVRKFLPDAVDLLEICVSAGMGLDMAWRQVADEMRRVSDTFADEMELTSLEINLGVPRAEAMRHMAERTSAEDLNSLVAMLIQAERFGASIADALTTFAKTMREVRSAAAEEVAEKMTVKLLFPMVLFIFPAMLVVMVGPAVLELAKVMG